MAMFSMFVATPPAATPVNTVYREKQAFGPFGVAAGEVSPDSGFSEALWMEVRQEASAEFRRLRAISSGEIKVVGVQDGADITNPTAPRIVSFTPFPTAVKELERICQAAGIETPREILYHGVSPESLENLVISNDDKLRFSPEGTVLGEIAKGFIKGENIFYLLSPGAVLGEVSADQTGHFTYGIEVRTDPPIVYSMPLSTLRENRLDPVVLFHTLSTARLSDSTEAIAPAEVANSWLEVVTKNRVLITFRDEWNGALISGEFAEVKGPSVGQSGGISLRDEQAGTIVAPDGWGQYTCQVSEPPSRKLTQIPSDRGASDQLTLNASAPAHLVVGSIRPEDWFHAQDPLLSDTSKELSLFTAGNLVTPLIDGFNAFSSLVADMQRVNSVSHFVLQTGWKTIADFELIPGNPDSTLEKLLTIVDFNLAEIYAMFWDYWGSQNTDIVDFINHLNLNHDHAILDTRHLRYGSHHWKCVVVRNSEGTFAHVGGVDINDNRLDGPFHEKVDTHFHDLSCCIEGPAVADVTKAFVDRWNDHPSRIVDIQSGDLGIEATTTTRSPDKATHFVQIARTYGAGTQSYAPNGDRTIRATMRQAIRRAKRYVYIEDQYLWNQELTAELLGVLDRIDFVIIVMDDQNCDPLDAPIAGYAYDVQDCYWARCQALLPLFDPIKSRNGEKILLFSLNNRDPNIFVHAKVMIIDDVFAAIGSANMNLRSMTHDSEIHSFIVDGRIEGGGRKFARDLRISLWAEHLGWDPASDSAKSQLTDVDRAVDWLAHHRSSTAHLTPFAPDGVPFGPNAVTKADCDSLSEPRFWNTIVEPDGSTP